MCNMDCFNCSLPDCDNDLITSNDIKLSLQIDRDIIGSRHDNRHMSMRKSHLRSREANKEKLRQNHARWREAHREEERERNRANYQRYKDLPEYKERVRENNRRYKARKKAERVS